MLEIELKARTKHVITVSSTLLNQHSCGSHGSFRLMIYRLKTWDWPCHVSHVTTGFEIHISRLPVGPMFQAIEHGP